MTDITLLWLPILLSSVVVFIASSIIHMLIPWHKGDYPKLQNEDKILDALRSCNIPDGDYMMPCAGTRDEMKSPEFAEKIKKGPVVIMTVWKGGSMGMGRNLVLWFMYTLVVGLFAGYVAGRALVPGSEYLQVFRFVGTTAFLGYSLALLQLSIWYRRSWTITIKSIIDGLIYALLSAGVFGWLWPH